MKILVDEMPKYPMLCPYSKLHETKQDGCEFIWYSCKKRSDLVCEDTSKCEFYVSLLDCKKEIGNDYDKLLKTINEPPLCEMRHIKEDFDLFKK